MPEEISKALTRTIPLTLNELQNKTKEEQKEILDKYGLELRSICENDHGFQFTEDEFQNQLECDQSEEYQDLKSINGIEEGDKRFNELDNGAEPTEEEKENLREYYHEKVSFEWEHVPKIWSGKLTTKDLSDIWVFASSPHSEEWYFEGFFNTMEEGDKSFFQNENERVH